VFAFGCNSNNGSNNNFAGCGSVGNGLPACPHGAYCGGPCDPDAAVTSCNSLACEAICKSVSAYNDAGVFVADAGTEWECLLP
jgi:hypothetical protein